MARMHAALIAAAAVVQESVLDTGFRVQGVPENASGDIVKAKPVTGNWYENDNVCAIKYNDATRRKQMTDWDQDKEKIFAKIEDIRSKLNRNGKEEK